MVDTGALATQLKGVIEYSILALLAKKQLHAVEVMAELAKYPGLAISEGTVYPVLNRLKREGLVHYDWSEFQWVHPRKHYRLSPAGEEAPGCLPHPVISCRRHARRLRRGGRPMGATCHDERSRPCSALPAVVCDHLSRVYRTRNLRGQLKETIALENLSLQIPRGSIYGLLGPNGAGKTTTVRILATLLMPTAGHAFVLDHDVVKDAAVVRQNIGLVLGGERGHYGQLTGRENLLYHAALNLMAPREAERRANLMLELVGLTGSADSLVDEYSRGMKQKLHLARGLLTDPAVLFLDEPTIGLDPSGAEDIRRLIQVLAANGKTILLTTHYMFEADRLCHRLAIINQGRLVVEGTPLEIKRRFAKLSVLDVTVNTLAPGLVDRLRSIEGVVQVDSVSDGPYHRITVQTRLDRRATAALATAIELEDVVSSIQRDPTLEEAYLSILR
ncbi:MAG: ATP-binding cassette domain-containing protein [Dehalococcoidia bacterium]